MDNSGIYIRVDNKSKLLETLTHSELKEWLSGLDRDALCRTIVILCYTLAAKEESVVEMRVGEELKFDNVVYIIVEIKNGEVILRKKE